MGDPLKKGQVIGKGASSEIFYWGEGKILKLFKEGWDEGEHLATSDRELEVTRRLASVLNFVPNAYEMIEHEGRKGIILDYVEGPSLMDQMMKNLFKINEASRIAAGLQAKLHAIDYKKLGLEKYLMRGMELTKTVIETSPRIPEDIRPALQDYINELPYDPRDDVIIHGDFHARNIIMTEKGPFVIDLGSAILAPRGAGVCYSLILPGVVKILTNNIVLKALLGMLGRKYARLHFKHYLDASGVSKESIEIWMPVIAGHLLGWDSGEKFHTYMIKMVKKLLKLE